MTQLRHPPTHRPTLSLSLPLTLTLILPFTFILSSAQASDQATWATVAASFLGAVVLMGSAPEPALAVPQTSACATEACDGNDYSNRDLRKEYYTKGSLKGANFSNSDLSGISLFGANLENANFTGANLSLANLGQSNLDGANLTQVGGRVGWAPLWRW